MTAAPDHAVCELGRSRPALRRGLIFTPQSFAGKDYVVIEDPLNSKFHRIGTREYRFISLLDGRTAISEALHMVAAVAPGDVLTEDEAAALCKWLIEAELAATAESAHPDRLSKAAEKAESEGATRRWNPLSMQWPLLAPDRLFTAITPALSWLFSRWAFGIWTGVVSSAAYQALAERQVLTSALADVFVPANWLWLALAWLVLKMLHETAHGVACKKYGGTVRVAGLTFVLFAPIAYVDVTSSWRFRSKWQRMHVAAAGIYFELLIAALALFVWQHTEPGVLNHVCLNVAIMASATTLFFNANPLMRFDGYYILSDLLEIPNLHSHSQQWLVSCVRRHLLGLPGQTQTWPLQWALFIRGYALAAFAWRVAVCIGLIVSAANMFHGAGIALAAFAVVAWVAMPVWRFVGQTFQGTSGQRPCWRRLAIVGGISAAILVGIFIVPWPGASFAPAVVEYANLVHVRAGASGFVRKICVTNGELVEPGQVLAVLENRQLEYELADLELALRQSELSSRASITRQKLTESQAEQEKTAALQKRIEEKRAQVAQLTIRAAQRGQIVGRSLDALVGTYLREGDSVLEIGDESSKELQLSVGQNELDPFVSRVGGVIQARVPGPGKLPVRLTGIEPRASLQLKHLSLGAIAGGPIPVKQKGSDDQTNSAATQADNYEVLTPRFNGVAELTPDQSRAMSSGQTAVVWFRPINESVGGHLYNQVARWLRQSLTKRSGSLHS